MPNRSRDRIYRAKFQQPLQGIWEFSRPVLLDRLDEGRTAPLSIICGMAGSGKTTLARQWASERQSGAIWIALEERDNELERFLHLLIAAIRTQAPSFGARIRADLAFSQALHADDLAASFEEDLLETGQFVTLILDDFQCITRPELFDFLETILRFRPKGLHVCFISRTDPPLPLSDYRAHFVFTEIRLAQLLFTVEETELFLQSTVETPLPDTTTRAIFEQTEGWITGLQLTALAMRDDGRVSGTVFERQYAVAASMDFLAETILAGHSESAQRHLLLLAIPERVNAELGWYLLNDNRSELEVRDLLKTLEANGYFLTSFGANHAWYRFHPLLRDTLIETSKSRFGADELRRGNLLAARWYAENRYIDQAIDHYLAAGDSDAAANLVERHATEAIMTDNWLALEDWLRRLPDQIKQSSIDLSFATAWTHQLRGSFDALPLMASRIRTLAEGSPNLLPGDRKAIELEVQVLENLANYLGPDQGRNLEVGLAAYEVLTPLNRSAAHFATYYTFKGYIAENRWEEFDAFVEALLEEHGSSTEPVSLLLCLWTSALKSLAGFLRGDLLNAHDELKQIAADAMSQNLPRVASLANCGAGMISYQRNLLQQALAEIDASMSEPTAGFGVILQAGYELTNLATVLGSHEKAEESERRLVSIVTSAGSAGRLAGIRALQASNALFRGDNASALTWALTEPDTPQGHSFGIINPKLLRAKILLECYDDSAGSREIAQRMLNDVNLWLMRGHVHQTWLAVQVLQARLLDLEGRETESIEMLANAIQQASGFVRAFIDQGSAFTSVFAKLVDRWGASGFARVLLAALDDERTLQRKRVNGSPGSESSRVKVLPEGDLVKSLSEREREVLSLLALRQTNKEIGAELGISDLTVKRHTISIYAKLGAKNRRQAVRLAFPDL